MKNKGLLLGIILFLLLLLNTGCVEYLTNDGSTTYQSHPTKINYTVRYGYYVNCTGTGIYKINYDCDIPEVLSGTSLYDILHKNDYEIKTIVDNRMVTWNISGQESTNLVLGIQADVQAESFMISDLNGENALNISEIKINHPDIVERYCQAQVVDDVTYIDPDNTVIKNIAENILAESNSENSFIVAKNLFKWLKENTSYYIHYSDLSVRPAITTYQESKGDCDDLSVLYISLCRALEIPARFIRGIIIDVNSNEITATAHAWPSVFVGGDVGAAGWVPVECAGTASGENKIANEINQNFAMESVGHLRLFRGKGDNESLNVSMSGPIAYYDPESIDFSMVDFIEITNYQVIESNELYIDKNGIRTYK